MKVSELLEYVQENLDDGCLTPQSEVYLRDCFGDIQPIYDIRNDCNSLVLAKGE